jgi:hypothetical protein
MGTAASTADRRLLVHIGSLDLPLAERIARTLAGSEWDLTRRPALSSDVRLVDRFAELVPEAGRATIVVCAPTVVACGVALTAVVDGRAAGAVAADELALLAGALRSLRMGACFVSPDRSRDLVS